MFGFIATALFMSTMVSSGSCIETLDISDIMGESEMFGAIKVQVPSLEFTPEIVYNAVQDFTTQLNSPEIFSNIFRKFNSKFIKIQDVLKANTFKANVINVFEHNLNYLGGRSSFLMGINQYTDLTLPQVLASYTGALTLNNNLPVRAVRSSPYKNSTSVPDSLDWRTACNTQGTCGIVSPVKNQGSCGSCVLFAVNAALGFEPTKRKAHTRLYGNSIHLDFSEQELLDCPPSGPGILRCNGNSFEDILGYVNISGLPSEVAYPYRGRAGSCRRAGINRITSYCDYFHVPYQDEAVMKEWLAKYGPLMAMIQINSGFQNYKRGVLDMTCDNTKYDHAVALVGYGRENGKDYWIAKNSWGATWGEKGYIKMLRNGNNFCQISSRVILPRLGHGYFNPLQE